MGRTPYEITVVIDMSSHNSPEDEEDRRAATQLRERIQELIDSDSTLCEIAWIV